MLAVAGANSSRHCSFADREWALAEGFLRPSLPRSRGCRPSRSTRGHGRAIAWANSLIRNARPFFPTFEARPHTISGPGRNVAGWSF